MVGLCGLRSIEIQIRPQNSVAREEGLSKSECSSLRPLTPRGLVLLPTREGKYPKREAFFLRLADSRPDERDCGKKLQKILHAF